MTASGTTTKSPLPSASTTASNRCDGTASWYAQGPSRDGGAHDLRLVRRDPVAGPGRAGLGGRAQSLALHFDVLAGLGTVHDEVERGSLRTLPLDARPQVAQLL